MGKQRVRRQFSNNFKRQVVAETLAARTSVSVVARRHDINANLLFRWRDDPRYSNEVDNFLPIEIDTGPEDIMAANTDQAELGIWIEGDVRFVVKGAFDPVALGSLIRIIRSRS
jgi:transposase